MLALLITLSLAYVAQSSNEKIDAEKFLAIIVKAHGRIKDFECVCEGTLSLINRDQLRMEQKFQSIYAYRDDGSVYWDIYRKPMNEGADFKRLTYALLGKENQIDEIVRVPDKTGKRGTAIHRKGTAATLAYDGSPARFIPEFFWREYINNPGIFDFGFEGWEKIEANNCGIVRLSYKGSKDTMTYKFWIDFEHDAQPRRIDIVVGGYVFVRITQIGLIFHRFNSSSNDGLWFPNTAVARTLPEKSPFPNAPHYQEYYQVVQDTLLINQNAPDSRFKLEWRPPAGRPGINENLKEELASAFSRQKVETRLSNNPADIEKDLRRMLDEADKQDKQLEAISQQPAGIYIFTNTKYILIFIGIALIIGSIYLKKRK